MTVSPWQRRIGRARELIAQRAFAAEILGFYIQLAGFQEALHCRLAAALPGRSPCGSTLHELGPKGLAELGFQFGAFLSLTEKNGPQQLAQLSKKLRACGRDFWSELLNDAWMTHSPSDARGILALAFLQPYAELVRSRAEPGRGLQTHAFCPFCNRKPGFGVLRQMGDGAARSLICSFCLAEWEFRRIVCPGCGEENNQKLPVFSASDFDYIRVECCDSCKTYVKTVDFTKNGRAEPIVDELVSAPLDLWAREHGYAKLQINLLGL